MQEEENVNVNHAKSNFFAQQNSIMKIEIDLELLQLIDRRALTLNQLPRKKKKKLKKELASLVINIANKEANSLFHNHIQESYKDLIKELEEVQSQISSIHEDHSQLNNE